MSNKVVGAEIERLIQLLSRLPGLGPRSARRAALHLVKNREKLMQPLSASLADVLDKVTECSQCGNVDVSDPCTLCADPRRDRSLICVVEEVGDLWALERAGAIQGMYHVLGGTLSAIEGVRPEDLRIASLIDRVQTGEVREVMIAVNATVDGQTTAHYIMDQLEDTGISVTRLAHGVPVGGELDYLDEGTLAAAVRARRAL
ncbi:MAG: recombination mediator RecR [Anderseniella sp.]|jgi:recombination protein RecR|nr:recombination mediator RecR [Anderseniella sp.]